MVDSQSWLQHSEFTEGHFSLMKVLCDMWSSHDYHDVLGEGCECRECEEIVGKPPQVLPIRDFFWGGGQHIDSINLSDEFYLLCRPVVRGYALNERKWGMDDIN